MTAESPGSLGEAKDNPSQSASASTDLYRFENVEVDAAQGSLTVAGKPVELEPRPMRLLLEFLRHAGEVVTKDELLQSVWDGRVTVEHVLANAVSKLRTALGPAGAARLQTLPRVGYRLQGPVIRASKSAVVHRFEPGRPVPLRANFELVGPLGNGPRYDVWLARHAKLGHLRVFKFADDGERLSALKREYTLNRVLKQELGQREDFATVIDTNFLAAPYFLECEYGGLSLLEWAVGVDGNGVSRLTGMPSAERLALFMQIAGAVAAAHSVGVLHKDLKPANVLVQVMADQPEGIVRWQVRLTDFGSGRLIDPMQLERLRLTAMGLTHGSDAAAPESGSGTWGYMAPELATGHAPTVQSDVYSLGVMLFQMVVGDLRRPLVTGWQRSVDDQLLVEEIARATEGSPADRTTSAANMVNHLARLGARRAERAAHESAVALAASAMNERHRRLARRPWVVMGVSGMVAGLALSLWMAARADGARQRAESARSQAQAVSDFLHQDVLESPDVVTSGMVRPIQLLDVMRRASTTASERFKGQPLVEAMVRRRIAESLLRRASVPDARSELVKAERLLVGAVAADSEELLIVRFLYARTLLWARAREQARRVLESAEQLAGAGRMNGMTDLGSVATQARIEFLLDTDRPADALPLARHLLAQTDARFSADSHRRVEAREKLVEVFVRAGMQKEATVLVEELALPPFNSPNTHVQFLVRATMLKAEASMLANRADEAEVLLVAARALLLDAGVDSPYNLAWIEEHLGNVQLEQGKFRQALQSNLHSFQLFLATLGPGHGYVATAQNSIGWSALRLGHWIAAQALFEESDRWATENGRKLGNQMAQLGRASALIEMGRAQDALQVIEGIDRERLQTLIGVRALPWVMAEHARALLALGRGREALPMLRDAVSGLKAVGAPKWQVATYAKLL